MASPVTVALVLEPAFEVAHLHALAQRAHVWVVGTEFNVASARTFWATFPKANLTSSLTTFVPGAHPDRAAACLAMLDTIELHHGTASAPSPYPVLEVVGSKLEPKLEHALRELGFSAFSHTANGFGASRQAAT